VTEPQRVLYAASECAPLTKTGGLGDVAAALPAALLRLGVDVRVLLPGYREVMGTLHEAQPVARIEATAAFPPANLLAARHESGFPLLVVACPVLYERHGGPYLDPRGRDWPDNALRFGLFSFVAALLASPDSPLDWRCELVHCNDWQTALAPAYLHWRWPAQAASVMTIHNLAYQGIFPAATLPRLGLPQESFDDGGVEYYGKISFLRAGLHYATLLSTVSPTYAREIQSEPLGFGMQALLATRSRDLHGILNGIDSETWDPAADASLPSTYDAQSLERKAANKEALQKRFGLAQRSDCPLFGVVSRLIEQKGSDLVVSAADALLQLPAQLIVLGTGDEELENALAALATRAPGMVAFVRGFDEALSHGIEAGADIFLMPSRFEPCGLNQMYSQRYGTPPVVRRTGGLADSVVDCSAQTLRDGSATGFVFQEPNVESLMDAMRRAHAAWRDPETWRVLQRNGMARDFDWREAALRYCDLYRAAAASVASL
jgi:starch synthase